MAVRQRHRLPAWGWITICWANCLRKQLRSLSIRWTKRRMRSTSRVVGTGMARLPHAGHYFTRYIDGFLLCGILLLMATGLITLFSATDANSARVTSQAI